MNLKHTFFLFCFISCFGHSQNDTIQKNFYLKAHSLMDDILKKSKGSMVVLKNFDFSNEKDLATSPLYDKMLDSHKRWYAFSKDLEITTEDYDNLKDKTGWVMSSSVNCYSYWDKNLLLKSTPILVDSIISKRRRNSGDPIPFRPIQINFKGNLALIEYELSKELELAAYILYKGNWQLIGLGSYFVPRQE